MSDVRSTVADLLADLRDIAPVMPTITDIIRRSIDKNFVVGGRYGSDNEFGGGSTQWLPSKDGGDTLGRLGQSVTVTAIGAAIGITSTHPGAAAHQYGARTGRGHAVLLEARPYAVIQNEDLDDISSALLAHWARRL